VKRIATLLGVAIGTGSKVMSAHTNPEKTASVNRNSERKSTLTERDIHVLRKISSERNTELLQHR
jgi:hypothetical protein